MGRINVTELQSRIAAVVDLDENVSNLDTEDESLRRKYMEMAQREWAESSDWRQLYAEYNMLVSTSTGNASIALPSDFRKLSSYVHIAYDGTQNDQFSDIRPTEQDQYNENDKRVAVLGSPTGGYILRVFGASLASGTSVKVPYYRSPVSLATGTTVPDVPNPEYLVQRTIAYVWEARGDERFPLAKAEAQTILSNMIEYENVFGRGADWDRVKTVEQTRNNFRIGRD